MCRGKSGLYYRHADGWGWASEVMSLTLHIELSI